MSQPLQRNGNGFLVDKRFGLTCFSLGTGEKRWDDGNRMTPKGRNPQSTMVWIGDRGRALILNSHSELILADLTDKGYMEISRRKIVGETWAHPAYADDYIYARDDEKIVCGKLHQ